MYSYSQEDKKVFIWVNGKGKENLKTIYIHSSINSIRRLQDLICESVKNKYSPEKMIIFNYKGIELDEADLPYIKANQILYVSLDGRPFDSSNYINQFEFVKGVKTGGYGKVYIAINVITSELMAIKRIDTGNLSSEEIYNISREAVYLESFRHSNIIKIHLSFLYNNNFYTVMELAKGGELGVYLKEKKILNEEEAKRIFRQIHHAVRYIHSKNVIHRDLNPNNILFLDEEKENIVLIDFGISGMYSGNVKEKINAGTIRFVPPEVASGSNISSNPKIDNWALGVILYLMLFGVHPFDGDNDGDILNKIYSSTFKFPKDIPISKTCKKIITQFLDKNPQTRLDLMDDILNIWYEETEETAVIDIEEEKVKKGKHVDFKVDTDNKTGTNKRLGGIAKSTKGVPLIRIDEDLEDLSNLHLKTEAFTEDGGKIKQVTSLTSKAKSSNKVVEKVSKKVIALTPSNNSLGINKQSQNRSNFYSPSATTRSTVKSKTTGAKESDVKKNNTNANKK